eukprot:1190122-Prorocentrum_minimum.AAC.3
MHVLKTRRFTNVKMSHRSPLHPLWIRWVYIVDKEACHHKVLTAETQALTGIGPEERNPNGPSAVPQRTPVPRAGVGL